MKVKLKKLHDNAKLPVKATSKDFCYDVVAVWEKEVAPNVWQYGLGFAYEIERDDLVLGDDRQPLDFTQYKVSDILFSDISASLDITIKSQYLSNVNISLDFRPRSSVWKTGMVLSNCEGTLDELYRGEVRAVYYHVLPDMPRYKVGDRIGQIKLGFTLPIEFEFVDEIDMNTDRGTGGFGSTGK